MSHWSITSGLFLTSPRTHTHLFNGPLSRTTRVSRYQKGKPIWILLKQETVSGSGISWAICKSAPRSRQITTPAPHHSFFTDRMPFLPPNQQRQSTEGTEDFTTQCFVNCITTQCSSVVSRFVTFCLFVSRLSSCC